MYVCLYVSILCDLEKFELSEIAWGAKMKKEMLGRENDTILFFFLLGGGNP